jgi:hypothetical protein
MDMRKRWRLVLPVVGLILFAAQSYASYRFNQELGRTPRKYYWWSSIRLDSDPLNRSANVLHPGEGWERNWVWVDSGYLAKLLMFSGLPAFALGAISVGSLAQLGVNEVWSFAVSMPLFMFGWFYFIGWLIDRWLRKRKLLAQSGILLKRPG